MAVFLVDRLTEKSLFVGLWKVLLDNNLSHKVLISVLYSFIESCDKVSVNHPSNQSVSQSLNQSLGHPCE